MCVHVDVNECQHRCVWLADRLCQGSNAVESIFRALNAKTKRQRCEIQYESTMCILEIKSVS